VGLSMTSILTFSVYSVRVSSDIPAQSEYLPIIGYYFIFVITFILVDFLWFIVLNFFADTKHIPKYLRLYAANIRKLFTKIKRIFKKKIETEENNENKQDILEEINQKDQVMEKENCIKCDLCKKCQEEKLEEEKKKIDKKELDANITALNLTAFTIIFSFQLIANLSIWLALSY
jgi:hypothetical protein